MDHTQQQNYFQGTVDHPYHVSIGAVLLNDEGKITCHFFKHFYHKSMGEFKNLYLLMRETIEPGESIETCLARGLMEEFGATATLKRYIGSIISKPLKAGVTIEKTTLYFECELTSIDLALRRVDDPESGSEILWFSKSELAEKMKEQKVRFGRDDVDESVVVERVG